MNTKFRRGNFCAKIDTLNGFHENVLGVFSLVGTSWIRQAFCFSDLHGYDVALFEWLKHQLQSDSALSFVRCCSHLNACMLLSKRVCFMPPK